MVKVKFIYVADQFTRGRSPFCSSAFVFVLAAGVFGRAQLAFENTYLISAYHDFFFPAIWLILLDVHLKQYILKQKKH